MKNRGFSLVEMLVVVTIIGILSTIITRGMVTAAHQADVAVALQDMRQINTAATRLETDTGKRVGAFPVSSCYSSGTSPAAGNGTILSPSDTLTGLVNNSSDTNRYPSWRGPYLDEVPVDPWGNYYIFETHYQCTAGEYAVESGKCEAGNWYNAIISGGPNGSTVNQYDRDNVAYIICAH